MTRLSISQVLLLLAVTAAPGVVLANRQPPTVRSGDRSTDRSSDRWFERVLLLEAQGETSAGVSMGDIDGDADLDLILAKGRHWPLNNLVLRNDGRGHFTSEPVTDSPDRTYTAALADLDGDGDLDLVVSNDRPDRKLVYLNDGRGYFRVTSTFGEADWSTRYVTVADVNGDRRPDLIVANRGGAKPPGKPSFVCLNDGKGAFPACTALATQSATIIVASDLDGDGHVDLFVPHRDGGQSLIFWNDGHGAFATPPTTVGGPQSSARAAATADIDGDGIKDLVVGDEKDGLFLIRGRGARAFATPTMLGDRPMSPYSIGIADMNRDGAPDIVVGNDQSPGVVLFTQRGTTGLTFRSQVWNDGKGAVYGLALGDLDGDGWPDIAAARSDAPNGVWFSGATAAKK
jgi:hypothetical protein